MSNGRKTVRMAPILTTFGPNESQRCQLNFEKKLGRRKNFREGEKFEKLSRKVRKILARTRFLGRNKIEMVTYENEKEAKRLYEIFSILAGLQIRPLNEHNPGQPPPTLHKHINV